MSRVAGDSGIPEYFAVVAVRSSHRSNWACGATKIVVQMVDNGLGLTIIPEMAVAAGLLNGTDVQARPLNADHATREIALIWRTNSPRREEFELLADSLRELHTT